MVSQVIEAASKQSVPIKVHRRPVSFVSTITGRSVWVNLHATDPAVLPERFSIERLTSASIDWENHVSQSKRKITMDAGVRNKPLAGFTIELKRVADNCFSAQDPDELASALEGVLHYWRTYAEDSQISGTKKRVFTLIVLLWKYDLVLLPAGAIWQWQPWHVKAMPDYTEETYGPRAEVLLALRAASTSNLGPAPLTRLMLACSGVVELGDIDGDIIAELRPHMSEQIFHDPRGAGGGAGSPGAAVYALCDALSIAQKKFYAEDDRYRARLPQSYRDIIYPRGVGRADVSFAWAAGKGALVETWRADLEAYVGSRKQIARIVGIVTDLNALLDYVIEEKSAAQSPLIYCARIERRGIDFSTYLANRYDSRMADRLRHIMFAASKFFDWILKTKGRDARGHPDPAYHNPLAEQIEPFSRGHRGQTYRNAIPLAFLRMMQEVLEDPEIDPKTGLPTGVMTYAWAKSLPSDYFPHADADTGRIERIWSPVRTHLLLLRLVLPLRGFQVRMLDSGEGDDQNYRPDAGSDGWVKNLGRHKPKERKALPDPQGFVTRIYDHATAAWVNGLYVNTNKTADRNASWEDAGYKIPWAPQSVLRSFCIVRDFQEIYNPSLRALRRDELTDRKLHPTSDVAKRMQSSHFLFRDPCDLHHPQEPIADERVRTFWLMLLDEVERRLDKAGVRTPRGEPIRLITRRNERNHPRAAVYDMHSLRVAGLTHLVDAGVPIQILSAFVAGHASTLMTYYYTKPTPSQIEKILADAHKMMRVQELEKRDFEAWQNEVPVEELHDYAVFNADDGALRFKASTPASWEWTDVGICPVGGALCQEGGPLLAGKDDQPEVHRVHGPVPGPPRNCPMCRFFVTGHAWLGGLSAKYNETVYSLVDALKRLRDLETRRRDLAARYSSSAFDVDIWNDPIVQRADQAIEAQDSFVAALAQTLSRLQALIERARQVHEHRKKSPENMREHALVLNGSAEDFEYALKRCSEFELVANICEAADLYVGINATSASRSLGRLLDEMLDRNDRPMRFVRLSGEELREAAVAMTRLLRTRLGDENATAVVEGRKLLRDVGLEQDFTQILDAAPMQPLLARFTEPPGRKPATLLLALDEGNEPSNV